MNPKDNAIKKKLKIKHHKGDIGFDKSYKVLQGEARKHGDKVVFHKGFSKSKRDHDSKKSVDMRDIPF